MSMLVWARHLVKDICLSEVLFCCETTGGYDRMLCDYMYAKGIDIWRESALQIKLKSGLRRGKDDRADSLMIAEYAMRHMDKAVIYQSPSETIRELKALLLYRYKLTQEKAAKKVRMAQLKGTAAKSMSVAFILRDARKGIKMLEKSIKECEKQIQGGVRKRQESPKELCSPEIHQGCCHRQCDGHDSLQQQFQKHHHGQ